MSDRAYRLIFGALLLISLSFDLNYLIYGLIVLSLFEGITNWRIPKLVSRLRAGSGPAYAAMVNANLLPIELPCRFNCEAERVWRFVVALVLFITTVLFYEQLWFFPWFMGFAIFGAGVSGICPLLLAIKWLGFK
ncbi:hypothetical protein [Sulfuriferula nivalis]|uniref:DUF2892 domain-containing protein n=1 Tax=Sulfuriferula nivalis TaxID=2675298 RepID=A0A809SB82_9PROT|nr:hypothetical protein [Sulfuriferula nivalis]BBP02122.1 hypothetical protein SFSGTM_28300 [Sulfuriferula nivalis]